MPTIRGLVAEAGSGWGLAGGAWALTVELRPYRDDDGVHDGVARLLRFAPDREAFAAARAEAPPEGAVVEVTIGSSAPWLPRPLAATEFVLESWRPVEDPELVSFAAAVAPPAEVIVPGLGVFRFEPRLEWYVGAHQGVRVSVQPTDRRDPGASLGRVAGTIEHFERSLPVILEAIALRYFGIWQGGWAGEEDEGLSREEWIARLSVSSVTWDASEATQTYTAWFDDGDLFAGHVLEVRVRDGAVIDVALAG